MDMEIDHTIHNTVICNCRTVNIFSNGEIPELEVIAYEKEDTDKLIQFMIDGGNK